MDDEIENMIQAKTLKRKMDEFQEKYGFDVTTSDENEVMKKLKMTVESAGSNIIETEKALKSLESVS